MIKCFKFLCVVYFLLCPGNSIAGDKLEMVGQLIAGLKPSVITHFAPIVALKQILQILKKGMTAFSDQEYIGTWHTLQSFQDTNSHLLIRECITSTNYANGTGYFDGFLSFAKDYDIRKYPTKLFYTYRVKGGYEWQISDNTLSKKIVAIIIESNNLTKSESLATENKSESSVNAWLTDNYSVGVKSLEVIKYFNSQKINTDVKGNNNLISVSYTRMKPNDNECS